MGNLTMTSTSSSNNGSDDAFTRNLSPEIIAEQERIIEQIQEENDKKDHAADSENNPSPEIIAEQKRIMKKIEGEKARGDRMAGTQNMEIRELSIQNAVFC